MVASVGALLIAGYWFMAGPKLRPAGPAAGVVKSQSVPSKTRQPAVAPAAEPAIEREPEAVSPDAVPPAPGGAPESREPAPSRKSPDLGLEESGRRRNATSSVAAAPLPAPAIEGSVVQGPVGIAVQHTAATPSADELMEARRSAHLAGLSQRTAHNAAQTSAVPPHAVPAAIATEAVATPQAEATPERTTISLPPAQVGPLSLRLAAGKGDASAQFEVAARLAAGRGVGQDFAEAARWYHRAAAQGMPIAQYRLAALYERGVGVPADVARARAWYQRAAEQGNVKAMHNLAVMSAAQSNGTPDYASAAQWFNEAATRGLADSQFNLGVLHESGLGLPKSADKAYFWYILASRGGDKEAQKRRDLLKVRLEPKAVASAEAQAAAWKSRPTIPEANDAALAGNKWRNTAARP
jgi:localization factor PodJL